MIIVSLVLGPISTDQELGDYQFLALPRVGDEMLVHADDTVMPVTVTSVFHYPKLLSGHPNRETPAILIRVERQP